MKALLTLLVAVGVACTTSAQIFIDYPELYLGDDDGSWNGPDAFEVTEAPAKWAEKDAVVLAHKRQVFRGAFDDGVYTIVTCQRTRIKVQNFDGLREMGEIYFPSSSDRAGLRVIQPDGTQEEYDMLKEGVRAEEGSAKVAVPGLQIGSIIDYYFRTSSFSADEEQLGEIELVTEHYPLLYGEMDFWLNRRFFMCTNMNFGDVDYTYEQFDYKGRITEKEKDIHMQHLNYQFNDIDLVEDTRWTFERLIYPRMRYRHYKGSSRYEGQPFYGRRFEVRTENGDADEVARFVSQRLDEQESMKRNVIQGLRTAHPDLFKRPTSSWSADEQREAVGHAYRYMRFANASSFLLNAINPAEAYGAPSYDAAPGQRRGSLYMNWQMVATWQDICREWGLQTDLVACVPRDASTIDNLLTDEYIEAMVQVHYSDGETELLPSVGTYDSRGTLPYDLEGTKAVVLENYNGVKSNYTLGEMVIPASTSAQNVDKDIKEVTVLVDSMRLRIQAEQSYAGTFERDEARRMMALTDWAHDEAFRYLMLEVDQSTEAYESWEEDIEEMRTDFYERDWNQYKVESYDDYEILSTGRQPGEPFAMRHDLTLNGLVHPSGEHLVVELGRLIGGQVALDEEEYERTVNVDIPFAKTYTNIIKLNIPEGYEIGAIERLNNDVSNATGSFFSEAKLEGGQLVITSHKTYATHRVEAAEWPSMTEWLDAAYNFSKQKVVLRKS